jgi:hypothetical protein
MDQFRAEWKSMKRDVERQMALLGPPSGMRTTDENGKDTTKASKERLGRIRRLTGLDSPLAEGRSSVMTANRPSTGPVMHYAEPGSRQPGRHHPLFLRRG